MLAQQAREKYPDIFENYYRFRDREITISKNNKHFRVQSMIGDSTLLATFGFPILYGGRSKGLQVPGSIIITENIARKLFNKTDVLGESLIVSTEKGELKELLITTVL